MARNSDGLKHPVALSTQTHLKVQVLAAAMQVPNGTIVRLAIDEYIEKHRNTLVHAYNEVFGDAVR